MDSYSPAQPRGPFATDRRPHAAVRPALNGPGHTNGLGAREWPTGHLVSAVEPPSCWGADSVASLPVPADKADFASPPGREASQAPAVPVRRPVDSLLSRLAHLAVLVGVGTAFLDFAEPVMLPLVVAMILALALRPAVRWMVQHQIPTSVAAFLVVGLLLVPMGFGFFQFAGPAVAWVEEAPGIVTRLQIRFGDVLRPARRLNEVAANVSRITPPEPAPEPVPAIEVKNPSLASSVFSWTGSALVGTAETIALLFLLLASGDTFLHKFVHLMPTWGDKRRIVRVAHEIQQGISAYLFSIGWINFGFGLTVGLAFFWIGLPQPAMWGIAVGLLNFIPYFGPVVGVFTVGAAGLLAFNSVGAGLAPAGIYFGLHLLEANLLTPTVVGRRVQLHPVVVFAALIYFVWLWGLPGAWVAVPLVVAARIIGEGAPCLRPLAQLISR